MTDARAAWSRHVNGKQCRSGSNGLGARLQPVIMQVRILSATPNITVRTQVWLRGHSDTVLGATACVGSNPTVPTKQWKHKRLVVKWFDSVLVDSSVKSLVLHPNNAHKASTS